MCHVDLATVHQRGDGACCVMFACCRNVRLSDATIRNASGWSTFFLDCDDVDVRRVRIRCDRNLPNCDGLHFGACRDVAVEDCDVDAADDAIVYDDDGMGKDRDGWLEIMSGIAGAKQYDRCPCVRFASDVSF